MEKKQKSKKHALLENIKFLQELNSKWLKMEVAWIKNFAFIKWDLWFKCFLRNVALERNSHFTHQSILALYGILLCILLITKEYKGLDELLLFFNFTNLDSHIMTKS